MSGKTEVLVDSLRVSLINQHRIVLMKEKDGALSLPLFVVQFEAEAIVLSLQGIEISRPQTHDLLISVIKSLNAQILYTQIVELRGSVYYAELVIRNGEGRVIQLDCRPSDAIATALRAHVPIYVDSDLMDQYGILPETDVRQQKRSGKETGGDDDSLSAFQDFLSQV